MTPSLPPRANLEQLRNQAKDVLKAHRAGNPSCCTVLRHLRRFKDKPDRDILAADVRLQEVQFALAMDYGFRTWTDLKQHVLQEVSQTDSNEGTSLDRGTFDLSVPDQPESCVNTFSVCVSAAASALGIEDADRDAVYALSVNAFAPCLDKDEDCMAWTTVLGHDRHTDALAARFGLRFRSVKKDPSGLPPMPSWTEPEKRKEWVDTYHWDLYVPEVRAALANGEVPLPATRGPFLSILPGCGESSHGRRTRRCSVAASTETKKSQSASSAGDSTA